MTGQPREFHDSVTSLLLGFIDAYTKYDANDTSVLLGGNLSVQFENSLASDWASKTVQ